MRILGPHVIGAIAAAAALCVAIRAQEPPAPPAAGLIVGQVVDGASAKPVPNAIVDLLPAATGVKRVRVVSDPNGQFFFGKLPAGVYAIRASKAGYDTALGESRGPSSVGPPLVLAERQKMLDVKMSIWKFGVVTGTVTDEVGDPMPGVEVRAFRRTIVGGRPRFTPVMATWFATDDRGVYRIAALRPGDYMLAIPATLTTFPASVVATDNWMSSSPEFFSASRELSAPGSSNSQQIGEWVLQSPNRGPVPPAPVGERLNAYAAAFFPPSDGGPLAPTFAVASGEERTANLQLRAAPVSRISGTIVGPAGPLARTALRLVPEGRGESTADADFETATGVTDDRGSFTLFSAASGQYILKVLTPRPGGGQPTPVSMTDRPVLWAMEPVTLGGADVTGLTISVRPVLTISGRLEFRGAKDPPSAAQLATLQVALDSGSGGPSGIGRPDEHGQFAFGAAGGAYTVRATEPPDWRVQSILFDGKDAADTRVDLKSDATMVVTFTDETTQISGVVRDDRNDPDAFGLVVIFPTDRQLWTGYGASVRRFGISQASKTGAYTLTRMPAGDYFVASIADTLVDSWTDPKNLDAIARAATRVSVADGSSQTVDLRHAR